jgi:ATP-dependent helicase HepA
MAVRPEHIGAFVQTGFGAGRLLALTADAAQVRFFRAPARNPYVDETMDARDVEPLVLPPHTRVYLHDGRRWRIGRVEEQHPDNLDHYLVAFPNSEGAVLPEHGFDVRWSRPVEDPYEILGSVGGDSPLVYQARMDVLASWSQQRRLAAGVEGLLLGSVELHRHQLEVVRRVTQDETKRYLLADEVGLGKTIEAAALIWQLLRRRPQARVLILVPTHLRKQWAEELVHRFRADKFPQAWFRIHSHTDSAEWPQEPVDLLVIDEAHHVTRGGRTEGVDRARLATLAHSAEELLLLSATPVRSNEAGFLDLLYLLDPQHYQPDDLEEFVTRVQLRDQLALICQALEPDLDAFDLSLYAGELRGLFPEDTLLAALLDAAADSTENSRPEAIARVREHLSESYRLHHRLLRTRREGGVARDFSVRGRKRAAPFILPLSDRSDQKRVALLDALREVLVVAVEDGVVTDELASSALQEVASRCGSLGAALQTLVRDSDALTDEARRVLGFLSEEDQRLIASRLRGAIEAGGDESLTALVPQVARLAGADGKRRIVIATQFPEVAEAVAAAVAGHIGARRVAQHTAGRDVRENNASISRWRDDNDCSVLVCDAGAEEGLNLQQAELLIHLDLPWETFRVEQRIGRCDRHAPDVPRPIPSLVVSYGSQRYAQAWLELLSDGTGVFTRSVSSLQYILADMEAQLLKAVLRGGFDAIEDAAEAFCASLDEELTTIRAHDALDSLQQQDTARRSVNDLLLDSDRDDTLVRGFVTWLEGVGGRVVGVKPGIISIEPGRLQVPIELEMALAPLMGTSIALGRTTAARAQLPLPRAGHPQIDAVGNHLLASDRGVAFAVFRPLRGEWPPRIVFRTDFLVSAYVDETTNATAERLGVAPWLSEVVQEYAPPTVVSVGTEPGGGVLQAREVQRVYERRAGDLNLTSRPDLFRQLTEHLDWAALCANVLPLARAEAERLPLVHEQRTAAAADVRRRVAQRIDRARARGLAGLKDVEIDLVPLLEVLPQRLDIAVDVLGCGAIFTGDPSAAASEA